MSDNSVVVNIPNGIFYFRDSQHYLYAKKKTVLLEDITKYSYTFPFLVKRIYDAYPIGGAGIEVVSGYGAAYGPGGYGGPDMVTDSNITIAIKEDDNATGEINPYTRIGFNMDKVTENPVRTITDVDDINHEITISYLSRDNTPNCFGLAPDHLGASGVLNVLLMAPPAPSRAKTVGDSDDKRSYHTTRDSLRVGYDEIVARHAIANPLGVDVTDASAISWAKVGDIITIEIPVKVVQGVPTVNLADSNSLYYDVSSQDYKLVDSTGDYAVRSAPLHTVGRKFSAVVVNGPGNSDPVQGNTIYIKPVGWDNPDLFSDLNVATVLFPALMKFWDGIPPGAIIRANYFDIVVDQITDNRLRLKQTAKNEYDYVIPTEYATWQEFFSDSIVNDYYIAQLVGTGTDYTESTSVMLEDMVKTYELEDLKGPGSNIVLTDLLTSDADAPEFTNVQFRTKASGNKTLIEFNRADNRLYNPTFLKADDSGVPTSWVCSPGVVVHKDYTKTKAIVHDRCVNLPSAGKYVRQMVRKIDPVSIYTISAYVCAEDSVLNVLVYEFDNGGLEYTDTPIIGSGQQLAVTTIALPTSGNFLQKVQTTLATGIVSNLNPLTTDIVIEFKSVGGTTPLYLNCVQFEKAKRATEFSHSYDYVVVEHETGTQSYSTRFKVSALDNPTNNGFMVLDIVAPDLQDTGLPILNTIKANRNRVVSKYSIRPWAKLHGVNKFRQSSVFSLTRRQFAGEYFALPVVPTVSSIAFQSDVIRLYQTALGKTQDQKFFAIAEDKNLKNLSDIDLNLFYSFNGTSYDTGGIEPPRTDSNGLAWINAPSVGESEVFPYMKCGLPEFSPDITFVPIAGHTFNENEYWCLFNEQGQYSRVKKATSTGNSSVLTDQDIVDDIGYTDSFTPTHALRLSGETGVKGLVNLPFTPLLRLDTRDNGSSILSMFSTIDNVEITLPVYSKAAREAAREAAGTASIINPRTGATVAVTPTEYTGVRFRTDTVTLTKDPAAEYFSLPDTFNPIQASLEVSLPGQPSIHIYQSSARVNTGLYFYIDYSARRLYVSDSTLLEVSVSFAYHPVRIINNRVLFHRGLLFFFIKQLYNTVSKSPVITTQHSNTSLVQSIKDVVEPVSTLNFPLFIKLHVNALVKAKIKYQHLSANTELIYQHKTPLI